MQKKLFSYCKRLTKTVTRANLKCTGGFLAFKEMMIEKLYWMPFNVKKFGKFGAPN